MKLNALDYSLQEWQDIMVSHNQPKYRAKQVFEGLIKGVSFDNMTTLPQGLKQVLKDIYEENSVKIKDCLISKKDGTRKYIFNLGDGNIIEGVLMEYKYGNTICVSTQVGCRMNCAFCASGIDGLARNLSGGEILGEVLAVNADISEKGERCITNVVLMGSGEPLDNYDNVVKFLELLTSPNGLNVGARNISLSTCGVVDKIYSLAELGIQLTLTISLHAPNNAIRDEIMPINHKYPIQELMKAVRTYFDKTGRRIIFEYALINGVNDNVELAVELAKLLRGLPCHVNIINLNKVAEKGLHGSSKDNVATFIECLEDNNISVTLRRTMGSDIEGACGQLRRKILSEAESNELNDDEVSDND